MNESEDLSEIDHLITILREHTVTFRKGREVETKLVGNVEVTDVWMMPALPAGALKDGRLTVQHIDYGITEFPHGLHLIDLEFFILGVDARLVGNPDHEVIKDLQRILGVFPEPELLRKGPSYIDLGAALGDQEVALCLMGLGDVVGLWSLITPHRLGLNGDDSHEIAGMGGVWMSGYPGDAQTAALTEQILKVGEQIAHKREGTA